MAVPSYLAAVAGNPGRPGQINQLLVGHTTAHVYAGGIWASQTTAGSGSVATNGTWLAQSFVAGNAQTSLGQVWLQVGTVGGSGSSATITPLTVSLYPSSGNLPIASASLATTTLAEQFVFGAGTWLQVPFAFTAISPNTTYQIVIHAAGTSGAHYTVNKSNQTSGASTSPDGVTWTAQAYGFLYQIYDLTVSGTLQYLLSEQGSRWTNFTYDALNRVSTITDNTVAQDGSNAYYTRTLSYTSGALTGVA